jgi:ABC-2 type transport system permease protein
MTVIDEFVAPRRSGVQQFAVGWAMLARDARVLRKQFPAFVARVLVQPLLLLFTFTYVLPSAKIGVSAAGMSFATIMVPGIIASTMIFAGITGVTVPLIAQMGYPREIDDRILSLIPSWGIALQKIVSGAVQSLLASVLILPALLYLHAPGQAPALHVSDWPLLAVVVTLSSVLSASLGLLLGTLLDPTKFTILFNVIMMPALMLGCVYFPWAALGRAPWLQMGVLVNPIVYLSEAFRIVLTPSVPHLGTQVCLTALTVGVAGAVYLGTRSFERRVHQ